MLTTPNSKDATQPLDDASWDAKLQELDSSFLQSSAWAAFQESSGIQTYRLHGEGWACLLIEQASNLRQYLLAPYGPAVKDESALAGALLAIADFGRSKGAQWVRVEPTAGMSADSPLDYELTGIKAVNAPKQVNPRLTRLIDLSPGEDELLAGISSSTRSLIRQNAKEENLQFKTSTNPDDMQLFLEMIHTVSKRNRVNFHPDEYFLQQAKTLMPLGLMRLELALHDNKPVAAIVMHDFNGVSTYTYAASLPDARELNASALLLWHGAMLHSKAIGNTRLDLFGVAPDDAPSNHPWYGFSTFKRKFGGTVLRRGQTLDLPLKPASYTAYRAALKARRLFK